MARKTVILTGLGLCATMALPSVALAQQDRVSATEKGSLLIYNKIELRWLNDAGLGYPLIQDTFVHLTNDFPGAVDVKMYFVNGDAPVFAATWDGGEETEGFSVLEERMGMSRTTGGDDGGFGHSGGGGGGDGGRDHPGWNFLDNVITLTANEPAYWAASTGLPKGVSPFQTLDPGPGGVAPGRPDPNDPSERYLRGYILAWAIDQVVADEIRWNHLAGDATLVNYAGEWAWSYNAWAFAEQQNVANGQPTGSPGVLYLNGNEYAPAFAELLMNFIASGSDAYSGANAGEEILHDTDLTLMPVILDHRQENDGPTITKASFDIWNENEVKFTNLDRCIACWDQELLSRHAIPNHFLIASLHTNAGKARIEGLQSFVVCGILSIESPLLGVSAKILDFTANGAAAAGNNLFGLGFEDGIIRYDGHEPPPESNAPEEKEPKSMKDILDGLMKMVK